MPGGSDKEDTMDLIEQITAYQPVNEQEAADKALILQHLQTSGNIYTRANQTAHMTASAWVVSPDRTQVLMAFHRIYNSWAWLGGHADGERDLTAVARREALEESGLEEIRLLTPEIISLEVLTVDGHEKRGAYVPSHLHLNVTYLFEADPAAPLRIKPDENSGVAWIRMDEIDRKSNEPWFCQRVYSKLCKKAVQY